MALLTVKDLNIEFHDHLIPETVVYDFDLELEKGDIVGIVGESGSGKTMSALAIAGLLSRHDMKKTGQILFEGHDLLTCERSILRSFQGNDISMIFQEPMTSLNPVKKVGWQVEESLRIHTELTPEQRYEKAIQMLAEVELSDPEWVYNAYPHELSGGMRQRVMIAAAMICEPKILIADEPTTALDVTIQAQIVELLKKINREKETAILFISHDLSLVRKLCTKVMVMQGGYVVETGDTEEIFANPKEEYTQKLMDAIPTCGLLPQREVPSGGELVASCENLNAYYPEETKSLFKRPGRKQVLHQVSLNLYEGEIVGLVGESGSGKSTLAKTLLGMVKDFEGKKECIVRFPQMIFQDPYNSLNPAKKVGWILEEPLRNRTDLKKEERKEKVLAMLKKVGLTEEYAERYPKELSGGQRQRVCIAAVLMLEPKLLIADEPVSALDVTIQKQVLKLLESIHEEMGLTILFISHDLRVVQKICDKVVILKGGKVVESGEVYEIYHHPKETYTKELLAAAGITG